MSQTTTSSTGHLAMLQARTAASPIPQRVADVAGDRPGNHDDQNTDHEHDRHRDSHADPNRDCAGNRSPLGDTVDRVRCPHESSNITRSRPEGDHDADNRRDYLEFVAAQLNNRPRKRLGWRTPAEALDELLSAHNNPPDVALTG